MSVQELINLKNSALLTVEKQLQFKENGRPKPILKLVQTTKDKDKDVNRHFKPTMYNSCDWICGCEVKNAFFCFPCLLFCDDTWWTKTGVKDIKHLKEKIKKHGDSTVHINSSVSFASLGRVDIKIQLDRAYRNSLIEFNDQVSKNRYIVNKLIDCVKFCGIFELPLRGDNEIDPGVFRGLINFVSELDAVFKNHIENSSVFKDISETIQNDLLDSMLAIVHKTIINEIQQADFLAIIADEITDASNKTHMIFLTRYVFLGKIYERFWKLINYSDTSADDITNVILNELATLKINKEPNKLIAQSYDGAAVTSGNLGGVQAKVKQTYPEANFVHCYAHQLNLIIQKTASQHRQTKVFFANLHAFSSFFSKSPERTAVLDKMVKGRMPETAPIMWNFNTRCVETVYAYKIDLINCLEIIVNTEEDDSNINQAGSLLTYLRDENFEYWLNFFHLIMPHVDTLFNHLQMREIDVISVKRCISTFNNHIQAIRSSYLGQPTESTTPSTSKNKKRVLDNTNTKSNIAIEICDFILSEIRQRFGNTDHLIVVQLFQIENFPAYKEKFPEAILQLVKKKYSKINTSKLKSELEVIYSREDFKNSAGALAILQLFLNMHLAETFSESIKLLEIICTIPMITTESERCFSTITRIKAFIRNAMSQSQLAALSMLSIERSFVLSIENFNEQVIDHFANQEEGRIALRFI